MFDVNELVYCNECKIKGNLDNHFVGERVYKWTFSAVKI